MENQSNFLLFGKWDVSAITCEEQSIAPYVAIKNHTTVAHSASKWHYIRFRKSNCPVVERLANTLMMHGRNSGKKLMANRHIQQAFELIYLQTGKNPVYVLVEAIQNAVVREDSCRIGKGGQIRRQAVDVAPLRRVNQALFHLGYGARKQSMRKVKTFAECLADELTAASTNADKSFAVQKKVEIERVAISNR